MDATQDKPQSEVTVEPADTELDSCYKQLRELRDRMSEVAYDFIKHSTLYYVLEQATRDAESAPMAQLTLDIPCCGDPLMTVPWPLVEDGNLVAETALPLLQRAARNYRDSWFRIKEVADAAVRLSSRIAELTAEEPAPMPDGEPNKSS
jgi:hypothetical protein